MIIDLKKIPKAANANLLPDLLTLQSNFEAAFWRMGPSLGRVALELLPLGVSGGELAKSNNAGSCATEHDRQIARLGYLLYEACTRQPDLKIETVSPVYNNSDGFIPATVSRLQRQMDESASRGEDDRFRYLPRREGFIVREGFKERGHPDFCGLGWEEFIWMTTPFAFHIRGELHRARVGEVSDPLLVDGLNTILGRYSSARVTTELPQNGEATERPQDISQHRSPTLLG